MASLASAARGNYVGEESGHLDDILGTVRRMGILRFRRSEDGTILGVSRKIRGQQMPVWATIPNDI